MSTYDEMRNSIISDMAREGEEGITAATDNAISLAIKHFETISWHFLDTTGTVVTESGTEYYDLPSDFGAREISVTLERNGGTYSLTRRTFKHIDDVAVSTTLGAPYDYAMYGDQIRFYPVPDATYTATVAYSKSLGPPTAAGSNAWTTECEGLVRARAEWQLYALRYHDAEAASIAKSVEDMLFVELWRKNGQRVMTGVTRKRA